MTRSPINFFDQHPLFVLDHDTFRILDVNAAAMECYGYSKEEFAGMDLFDLGEHHEKESLMSEFQGRDASVDSVWKHRTRDGTTLHVQFTSHLFRYEGRPVRIIVVHNLAGHQNGSERQSAILPPAPSKLANSPFAEIEWDKDFVVKRWSARAEELFGWPAEQVVGNKDFFKQIIHEDELDKAHRILSRATRANKDNYTVEGRNYNKRGEVLICGWYNTLIYDQNGTLVTIYSLVKDISERKQSEYLFRALSEESLVGVYLIQDDIFKYVNPRLAKIFHYEKEEIEEKLGPVHLTHRDDWERVSENVTKRINGSISSLESDFRGITKGGKTIHVNAYGTKITYLGKPAIVGTLVDITDSKLAFERYRASVESFEDLFDSISDAIYILDRDGRLIEVNQSAIDLNGYDREYLIGKTPEVLIAPGKVEPEEIWNYFRTALKGEVQRFEQWGRRKNGEVFPEEVILNPGSYFGEDVVIAICRDISQRYKAEEQLRKNEELFHQLFQNAPIGIVMMDEHQEIRIANEAFENIFGYTSNEIRGLDIDKLIVPEQQETTARELSSSIHGGLSRDLAAKRKCKDGSLVDVLIYGVPVNVDGRTIAIFGIYVDITDRKKAEEQVRRSLKEKEVLLAEIHHRVKNNLAVITGLLELQTYNTDSKDAREVLYESQMRINSIALIHEKLYQSEDLSQISFDIYIKELTDIILKSISNQKDIKLTLDMVPAYLTVNQAIPCGLILNELITNAFKHAFAGRSEGHIWIKLIEEGDNLLLSVKDNGVGLPDDFDSDQPTSLGLTLITTLTSQLKGECRFTNTDCGSLFELRFKADR